MLGLPALRPGERRAERRARVALAVEEVFCNSDLVLTILKDNVGLSTFVACSAVNRMTRALCRSSEALLRSVALYCGGLTKSALCGLLALPWAEASAIPHEVRHRYGGGVFCLYGKDALENVLGERGGMKGVLERTRARADHAACSHAFGVLSCAASPRRPLRAWELEERLHRSKSQRCG